MSLNKLSAWAIASFALLLTVGGMTLAFTQTAQPVQNEALTMPMTPKHSIRNVPTVYSKTNPHLNIVAAKSLD